MNKKIESTDMATGTNDLSTACGESDTLHSCDIYYVTPWQGMNSSRILLLSKTDCNRSGVMEFILAHAWNG